MMEYVIKGSIAVVLFIVGAVLFSLLYRLVGSLSGEETQKNYFRAVCPSCGHILGLRDRLPIISFMINRGKCSFCGERLPVRQLVAELLGGLFAVALYAYYGISLSMATVFAVYGVLMVITCIDADIQEIPPALNISLLGIGIISVWTMGNVPITERLIGLLSISLPLLLIVFFVKDGFGGGDIKLMFASGFLLGWKGNVLAFFIGVIIGGIYGVYLLTSRKKGGKEHFAFGPCLCIGIAVSLYGGIGAELVNRYLEYIRLLMTPI